MIIGRGFRRYASILALAISPALQAQTFEVFDPTTAGLPSVTITDIDEDSQGIMWVGTEWGLCRYDGSTWTILQTDNSGLPDNRVTSLAVDTADRVWIGTVLGGLAVFDGIAGWEYFTTANSPLPDDQILNLKIDHRNWVWIGTFLGLMCYTGDEWRLYNDQPESYNGLVLNGAVIRDVDVREDGLVAIGTLNGGFHYMTDDTVEAHATYIDLFPDNTQNGVVFDTMNDERWLATPSQGLLRHMGNWEGGSWSQYSVWNSSIQSNSLLCVVMDPQGRPWAGSVDVGVIVRNPDDTFISYNTTNSGMPDDGVTCLHFASDGSLWLGTYGGGAVRMTLNMSIDEAATGLSIFPNPVQDHCTVRIPWAEGGSVWWNLAALDGRVATSGSSAAPALDLDLSAVEPGVFILTLVGSHGMASARLVRR